MIVRIDVERVEYGHIFIEVENYQEAQEIVRNNDFECYDVITDSNWLDNDWSTANGLEDITIVEESDEEFEPDDPEG